MSDAGLGVGPYGVEMVVWVALLLAELLDHWGHCGVVGVVHARKQVVLDLVVEAAVQETQFPATDVGRCDQLHGVKKKDMIEYGVW